MRVAAYSVIVGFVLSMGVSLNEIRAQAVVRSADLAHEADEVRATTEAMDREEVAAEDAWYDRHELALGVDGNLPGNMRVFDDSGKLIPAKVKLYFLQSGKVVSQATPNPDGDFQAVGLKSGTYSLVAAGESGFAALGVRIMPPPERSEPPKANTIGRIREVSQPGVGVGLHLNVSIIPAVDVQPAFGIASAANAGGLGSLPGLSGAGAAGTGSAGALGGTAGGTAAGGAAGGAGGAAGAAGAAGLSGAGGLFVAGAAGAGIAATSDNNNSSSGTSSTSSSSGSDSTASPNGS